MTVRQQNGAEDGGWELSTNIAEVEVQWCRTPEGGRVWLRASDWITLTNTQGEFEPAWLSPQEAKRVARALNKAVKLAAAASKAIGPLDRIGPG